MAERKKGNKLKRFISNCKRVLKLTRKPNKDEFLGTLKITGIGVLIMGLIGFAVMTVKYLVNNFM